MSLDIGIVGLPNVGKSTLFKAITSQKVAAENYPFCTIEPNMAVVNVPDVRLSELAALFNSQKIIPNIVRLLDIAGLVKGAAKGAGLGNKFLSHIRQVDAIIEVLRCFDDKDVIHVENTVDPLRDIEIIHSEIILADLESLDKLTAKQKKDVTKKGNTKKELLSFLSELASYLNAGNLARGYKIPKDLEIERCLAELMLLSAKPLLFVLNLDDPTQGNSQTLQIEKLAHGLNAECVKISAKLEAEISELDPKEKQIMLESLGLKTSGLELVIQKSFQLLNQITFFTAGEKEVRAWNVKEGSTLPQAAGKIHSDMEKGFIRGEVYNYKDIIIHKTEEKLKKVGLFRIEGKDYQIKDGDIIHIRFNV